MRVRPQSSSQYTQKLCDSCKHQEKGTDTMITNDTLEWRSGVGDQSPYAYIMTAQQESKTASDEHSTSECIN